MAAHGLVEFGFGHEAVAVGIHFLEFFQLTRTEFVHGNIVVAVGIEGVEHDAFVAVEAAVLIFVALVPLRASKQQEFFLAYFSVVIGIDGGEVGFSGHGNTPVVLPGRPGFSGS